MNDELYKLSVWVDRHLWHTFANFDEARDYAIEVKKRHFESVVKIMVYGPVTKRWHKAYAIKHRRNGELYVAPV